MVYEQYFDFLSFCPIYHPPTTACTELFDARRGRWKEVSLSMYILWYAAADNASPAMLARNKKENRCKVQGVGSEKCRDAASASWVYGV